MKKLFLFLLSLPFLMFAQSPQGVGYQGVATDLNGIELINQTISIQASVLSSSATGNVEWQEQHSVTTDAFGLFTLTIGQGISTGNGAQANFADISWGSATHFLKIEMDVNGGTNYSHMGTNQMMSVPYALYAENANINYDSIATILSNDSSFTSSISSGGGGGPSLSFPDGLDGSTIIMELSESAGTGLTTSYTVPPNKNLYITNVNSYNQNCELQINSSTIFKGGGHYNISGDNNGHFSLPIICSSGDVISAYIADLRFTGLLVDKNVDPISINSNYTIPTGKRFVVLNYFSMGWNTFQVDQTTILTGYFNCYLQSSLTNPPEARLSIDVPLIFESGSLLTLSSSNSLINGYLVDENYFANSGTGGNNSGGGGSSTNDDGYGDFTDNSQITGNRIFYVTKDNGEPVLYETDSTFSFSNELFRIPIGNADIQHIYIDDVNQDMYFLTSNGYTNLGSNVMKTSLTNFNPQLIYVIPDRLDDIEEFKLSPTSGNIHWSSRGNSQINGLWKYDPIANQTVRLASSDVYSFCFDQSGNVYYSNQNGVVSDLSGNIVHDTQGPTVDAVYYDDATQTFFLMYSDEFVTNQNGNVNSIYSSQGLSNQPLDFIINNTTGKIIFCIGPIIASMDLDGNNLNYQQTFTHQVTQVGKK